MRDPEEIHARLEQQHDLMKDEQVLKAWEQECPTVPPITIELAALEGSLKGISSCLKDAAFALSGYSGFGDDLRFFAAEVKLVADKLQKIREKLY